MTANHRILVLLCGALLLAGCATQFVYNRLDWLLSAYLDYTLALDSRQSERLRQTLPVVLIQHRREHLPRYRDWLLRVRADVAQGITATQIDSHYQELQTYWQAAVALLAKPVAAVLKTATDAQIEQFLDNLRDASLENAHAQERPVRRLKRQLKPWLGSFTQEQNQLFVQWNNQFNALHALYVQSDAQWQTGLKACLQERHQPDFNTKFTYLLAHPDSALTAAQRDELIASEALVKSLLLELTQRLTQEQREYLLAQLQLWAADFAELTQQAS